MFVISHLNKKKPAYPMKRVSWQTFWISYILTN